MKEALFENPSSILNMMYAYKQSMALFAANELNLFDVLSNGELEVEEIAQKIETQTESTRVLLDYLVTFGLLVSNQNGRFANSTLAEKFLCSRSGSYLGDLIRFEKGLENEITTVNLIKGLKGEVAEDKKGVASGLDHIYMRAMDSIARYAALNIFRMVKFKNNSRLLDLGGGPGTFSIHFCRNNPTLHATVFDFPRITPIARENIKKHGLIGNIDTKNGNLMTDDLGKNEYDYVLLSNVMHFFNPEENKLLVQKAYGALKQGGQFILHDFFFEDDNKTAPEIVSILTIDWLTMGITFNFSINEMDTVFRNTGYRAVKHRCILTLPTTVLVGIK